MSLEYERALEEARLKLASSVKEKLKLVMNSSTARERLGDRLDLGGATDIIEGMPGRTGPEAADYYWNGIWLEGAFPVYDHEIGGYVHEIGGGDRRRVGTNDIPFERYRAGKLYEIAKNLEDALKRYVVIGNEGIGQLKPGQRIFYDTHDRGFTVAEVVSVRPESGRVQIRFNTSSRNDSARLTGRELIVNVSQVYL